MPDKLTDKEIVNALEEWRKEIIADYQRLQLLDAPMDCFEESHADTVTKLSNALDLINRQDAEIEKFEECASREMLYQKVKAEAYKEFAEDIKATKITHKNFGEIVFVEDIDNLLKEMIGE